MEPSIFKDFNLSDFWNDSEYALQEYVEESPSDEYIYSIEQELGYKLPASYIELMKHHNGGTPKKCCFPVAQGASWAAGHCVITGIMAIGRLKAYALCGNLGSQFMIDEWGYPPIGICICDCPSARHDMIMLDYSMCGHDGEPQVVHVDQEHEYEITFLAKDFETFIRGLVHADVYDTSEQDLIDTLETLRTGNFSDTLQTFFKKDTSINFDHVLRNIFTAITTQKGYFGLHADELSYLSYDIQFYLLSINKTIRSKADYVKQYPSMVALGNNEITAGGYADFFEDWYDEEIQSKEITKGLFSGLQFTDRYKEKLFDKIKQYEK